MKVREVEIRSQIALSIILEIWGIRALYKGLGPTVVRSFFATGALFVAFEFTKKNLHNLMGWQSVNLTVLMCHKGKEKKEKMILN